MRKTLAALWLLGLLAALVGLSGQMSWRLAVIFLVLLALLAWGRSVWKPLQKLEPPLLLILALGIVLAAFGQTRPEETSLMKRWVELLLFAGTLGVCWGLVGLEWKRPVGGIVEVFVFAFCLLFPLAVLLFQIFVGRHFDAFSVEVGVGALAYQMLAGFCVYIVLSQFVLQDAIFRRQLRSLWVGAFCLIVLVGMFRFMALGKNVLVLRQLEFEPGMVLERAKEQAERLDTRLARQVLATREAKYYDGRQAGAKAVAALEEPCRDWIQGKSERRHLQRAAGSSALSTFLLGAGPVQQDRTPLIALAIDARRGRLFFVDQEGHLYVRRRETLQRAGRVEFAPEKGPVCDLLWWESGRRLLLLLANGTVAVLEIESGESDAEEQFSRALRPQQDLLRDLCFLGSGSGGYLVDAFGGIHPFGETPIRYEDLRKHRYEEAHYWPGKDRARAIDCTDDGYAVAVVDTYGGIHCMGKSVLENRNGEGSGAGGKVRYFGSTRDYFDRPVVASVVPAYDSYYLLHTSGRIERRVGLERMVELFHAGRTASPKAGFPALLGILLLGWILLRSPRRVPVWVTGDGV